MTASVTASDGRTVSGGRLGVDRRVDGWVDLESIPGRPPAPASTGFSAGPRVRLPAPHVEVLVGWVRVVGLGVLSGCRCWRGRALKVWQSAEHRTVMQIAWIVYSGIGDVGMGNEVEARTESAVAGLEWLREPCGSGSAGGLGDRDGLGARRAVYSHDAVGCSRRRAGCESVSCATRRRGVAGVCVAGRPAVQSACGPRRSTERPRRSAGRTGRRARGRRRG